MNNMNTTASSEMKVQSRKEARGGVREGEGESATQPQNTAKRLPLFLLEMEGPMRASAVGALVSCSV